MSSLHTRLTLFAVISAIEEDLRGATLSFLGRETPATNVFAPELLTKCRERFAKEFGGEDVVGTDSVDELLVYVDLGDLHEILNRNGRKLPDAISAYISSITSNLERLIPIRNRVCHNRPLNFEDFPIVFDSADSFAAQNQVHGGLWSVLCQTLGKLKNEPHFVLSLKIPDVDQGKHNLPSPDFDETGFLGRTKEVKEVRRLCEKSPYPVISLVGEGGLGKTAIALKVAYELFDSDSSPFDTIVWCSSKTAQVTPREIVKITTAIGDSLDLLRDATSKLSNEVPDDPLPELLQYLETFRVLIVFDNLETVLDQRIRDFLQQLPMGSKVLITSRIGVGAYDFPVKLSPMDKADSVRLLRAVAKSRGVESLGRLPNSDLELYCTRLKNNPGFVKWFVSGIQAGIRPEEALSNPDVFLQFCMDNIYGHLSVEARCLLDVMVIATDFDGLNQAELFFLSTLTPEAIQIGLQQLLTTNMVAMMTVPHGASFSTRYVLAELAADYLKRHHRPNEEVRKEVSKRKNQVAALKDEDFSTSKHLNPYNVNTVRPRNASDLVVAQMLRDALRKCRRGEEAIADEIINRAKSLSPDYWEVHRVEAFVNAERENVATARQSYEVALDLAPDSAPLRLWFGGFLLRNREVADAVEQFRRALKLDPEAAAIRVEAARAELYARNWDEADNLLKPLLEQDDLYENESRKVWDLFLQVACRRAEFEFNQRQLATAVTAYSDLKERWSRCPRHVIDAKLMNRLERTLGTMRSCVVELNRVFGSPETATEMQSVLDWAEFEWCHPLVSSEPLLTSSELQVGERCRGRVVRFEPWGALLRLPGGMGGWLHNRELSWTRRALASDSLIVGQEIDVVIVKLKTSSKSGRFTAVVSFRLTQENSWDHITEIHPINSRAVGTVVEFLPFGAKVEFESGFSALVHESELSWTNRKASAPNILSIGQSIPVVIQMADPEKRKLHASYRQAIPNPPWDRIEEIHPVNSRAVGTVVEFLPFGAKVEFESGFSTLVHESELSWTDRKASAPNILSIGQSIPFVIQMADPEKRKLHASYRQTLPNPWDHLLDQYPVGSTIRGTIDSVVPYGLFVRLPNGCVGLLHESDLPTVTTTFNPGSAITVRIREFDRERQRLSLVAAIDEVDQPGS